MLTPQAAIFLPLSLMLLTACSKGTFDPKLASNFCTHVQLGSDYEQVVTTLESNGLEVRARAEEASEEIGKGSSSPYTVDGYVITSKDLPGSATAPGCLIYFSSKLLGGDGRISYKQFLPGKNTAP